MSESEFSSKFFKNDIVAATQKREHIGLTPEIISGMHILDIHAGKGTFDDERFGAQITQLNLGRAEELDVLLEFPDKEFDLVTSTDSEVFSQVDALSFYTECLRVIKDGGEVRLIELRQGVHSPDSVPEGWTPEKELEYLLYLRGVDVQARQRRTNSGSSYLSLKRLL